MTFDPHPDSAGFSLLAALPALLRADVESRAERASYQPSDPIVYQGEPASRVGLLVEGHAALTASGRPQGVAAPGDLIDPAATLGGLPHTLTARAESACVVWWWPAAEWEDDPALRAAARQTLGRAFQSSQTRLADLSEPIHYSYPGAGVSPGPFRFEGVTLLLAFCEAEPEPLIAELPPGVTLLHPAGSARAPLLIGLADFPNAYPERDPSARFAYTETTLFIPVRFGLTPGVFVPWIYPSGWEPILIGREVYGFPKQPGKTSLSAGEAHLRVNGTDRLRLRWESQQPSSEAALVGALMGWLGIERTAAEFAFRAGDAMRAAAGLPAHRRVDVFNRKRIPAVSSTGSELAWDVDQLTHAVFGVLGWESLHRLGEADLEVSGAPLVDLNVSLREAYRTRLDMRLSEGRVARDYLKP